VIPVTGTGRTTVVIGVNANLELVHKFCYLGDILSVDGDADAHGWHNDFESEGYKFAGGASENFF